MIQADSPRRGASPRARPAGRPPGPRPRHGEFDALRATAILLVVALHSALAYTRLDVPRLLWGVREPSDHDVFDLFAWWAMGVSVPLFFAISGFFAAEGERARGPSAFLRGRVRRVVVPMLAVAPVLLPLCFFAWAGGWLATGRCTLHEVRRMRFLDPAIEPDLYGPAHLWFLEYLVPMLLAFGYRRKARLERATTRARMRADLAARANRVRAGRGLRRKKVRVDRPDEDPRPGWLLAPWAPPALAVPTMALMGIGRWALGSDLALDRHNSFLLNPIRLAHYAAFFAFGVGLHRVRDGLGALAGRGWWALAASIPVFALRAWLLPMDFAGRLGPGGALALAASGSLFTWLTLFGLIGVYRRHLARPPRAVRSLAGASFWLYLVHLPVVGLLQAALILAPLATAGKFAATLATTLILGLASDRVLVRGSRLGRFLGGKAG